MSSQINPCDRSASSLIRLSHSSGDITQCRKLLQLRILYIRCSFLHLPLFESFFPKPCKEKRRIFVQDMSVSKRKRIVRHGLLVDLLAVEGDTKGAEEQSAVSVVCGGGVNSNVEARNHLGRVP